MGSDMSNTRQWIGRILILFGLIGGFTSFWYTLQFTWMPEFQATELPAGPTHSNYHAFREAMLALAVNLLLIWAAIRAGALKFEVWGVITFMAVFYYGGWWLAWPIWGYHAPTVIAEMNHVIGTVFGLAGLIVLKPARAG